MSTHFQQLEPFAIMPSGLSKAIATTTTVKTFSIAETLSSIAFSSCPLPPASCLLLYLIACGIRLLGIDLYLCVSQ